MQQERLAATNVCSHVCVSVFIERPCAVVSSATIDQLARSAKCDKQAAKGRGSKTPAFG